MMCTPDEGSYIVTSDGEVTKYDENGEEIE